MSTLVCYYKFIFKKTIIKNDNKKLNKPLKGVIKTVIKAVEITGMNQLNLKYHKSH